MQTSYSFSGTASANAMACERLGNLKQLINHARLSERIAAFQHLPQNITVIVFWYLSGLAGTVEGMLIGNRPVFTQALRFGA